MIAFAAHTSFVVMGASEDVLHLTTRVVYEIMSVCICVKQQT